MPQTLTLLDVFAVLILLVTTVYYTLKGFFRGILGLAAVCAGFILAGLFYKTPASLFMPYVRTETVAHLIGYASIFLGVIIFKSLLLFIIYKILRAARLRWFDKVLGTVFGFIMGWIICTTLFLSLTAFPVRIESVEYSSLAPYFLSSAEMFVMAVPRELKQRFNAEYQKVTDYWNQNKG